MGNTSRKAILLKSLVSLTIICALVCIISAKTCPAFTTQDVVGIWLFDEGAGEIIKDSSGNGHDGKIVGNVKWVKGKFGDALSFPGVRGNYVRIPHAEEMNLITFTLMAFLQVPEVTGDYQCIINKEQPFGVGNYSLFIHKDTGVAYPEFWTAGQWKGAVGNLKVTNSRWHHVAGTYDKKSLLAYIDGALEAQTPLTVTPDTTPGDLRIGGRVDDGNPLKGIIDEVALFNKALTPEEIEKIMNAGLKEFVAAIEQKGKLATSWGAVKAEY